MDDIENRILRVYMLQPTQDDVNYVTNFEKTFDCLNWVISRFNSLDNIVLINFALISLTHNINRYFYKFDEGTLQDVREILFNSTKVREYCGDYESNTSRIMYRAQVMFFIHSYPDIWPTFWDDLCSDEYSYRFIFFIRELEESLIGLERELILKYTNIKKFIRKNNIDLTLSQFMIRHLSIQNLHSFGAYKYLLRWMDINNIFNNDVMTILDNMIKNNILVAIPISVLNVLIGRGMPIEQKIEFIENLNIINIVKNIIESTEDIYVIREIAYLVNTTGKFIKSLELVEASINILNYSSDDVSDIVYPLLSESVKNNHDLSVKIAPILFDRLTVFFENEYEESTFSSHLADIFGRCVRSSPEFLSKYFAKLMSESQTVEQRCAFLYIAINSFHSEQHNELNLKIIKHYLPIFEDTNIDSYQKITCISYLSIIASSMCSFLEKCDVDLIFNSLLHLLTKAIEDEDLKLFVEAALQIFVKKCYKIIVITPEIIKDLIRTGSTSLIQIAGFLITNLIEDENFDEILGSSIGLLQACESENLIEALTNEFIYIRSIDSEKISDFDSFIIPFLETRFPIIQKSDELLSSFIHTIFAVQKFNSLETISKYSSYICGAKSACSLASVLNDIVLKTKKFEWIGDIMPNLTNKMIEIYTEVSVWNKENEEMILAIKLVRSFYKLFSNIISLIANETLVKFSKWTLEQITIRIDQPVIYTSMLDFALSLGKVDVDLASQFVQPSLLFLQYPEIYELDTKVCKSTFKISRNLHYIILTKKPEDTVLLMSFKHYGMSEDFYHEYLKYLHLPTSQKSKLSSEIIKRMQMQFNI